MGHELLHSMMGSLRKGCKNSRKKGVETHWRFNTLL